MSIFHPKLLEKLRSEWKAEFGSMPVFIRFREARYSPRYQGVRKKFWVTFETHADIPEQKLKTFIEKYKNENFGVNFDKIKRT